MNNFRLKKFFKINNQFDLEEILNKVRGKAKGNYFNYSDLPGLFFLLIAIGFAFLYARGDFLGYNSKKTPVPTPYVQVNVPVQMLDLRDTYWNGNRFSGKITNNNKKDIFKVEIKLAVSKDPKNWEPENHYITVPYKINAGDTLDFSEEANQFIYNSWWSSEIVSAMYYNGEDVPSPTPIPTPQPLPQSHVAGNSDPWGVAKQISEHTWTIKVGQDDRMATPQEIYDALNVYRDKHGVGRLGWNDRLASYAQSRADSFNTNEKTDEHAGFMDFLDNQDGYNKLGFNRVGENSSYGYRVLGVHLIEWIYASDAGHDGNQRDPKWTSVGIGVNGTSTDLIFGGDQM